MVNEQGLIVDIGEHDVVVEVLKTSACQTCAAKQGCGQAVLAHWGDPDKQQKKNHFRIPVGHHQAMNVGDRVELSMAHDTLTKVALLVYLVPLLVAFIGLFSFKQLGFGEGIQLLMTGVFFGGSFWLLSKLNVSKSPELIPQIVRLYPSGKGGDLIASTASKSL